MTKLLQLLLIIACIMLVGWLVWYWIGGAPKEKPKVNYPEPVKYNSHQIPISPNWDGKG